MIIAGFILTMAVFSISASGGMEQDSSGDFKTSPVDIPRSDGVETATFGLG